LEKAIIINVYIKRNIAKITVSGMHFLIDVSINFGKNGVKYMQLIV